MRRILVAIDGSTSARLALDFAIDLASEHQAALIIAYVVPVSDPDHAWEDEGTSAWTVYEPTHRDRAILADAAAEAGRHDVEAETVLLPGPTIHAIVDAGELHDATMIVVGTRGHRALASLLTGSVSRGVLRRSSRPVVIVHGGAGPGAQAGGGGRPWFLHPPTAEGQV